MVHFESNKMVIEITYNDSFTAADMVQEWKELQGAITFLCANVEPTFADSIAVKTALAFADELLPDDETALKMILQ